MFREPAPERHFPTAAVVIAAVAVALLVTVLVLAGRRHADTAYPKTILPAAPYASNLALTGLQMSQSGSMAGGKQTYIEGRVINKGPKTVTGITVQAVFANDAAMPPQVETSPLNIIYMREPYLDTRPVSASPLAPGGQEDFRLIFEDVGDNWNQQMPQLHITQVSTK
jgi:hypothetical protein